MDLDHKDVKIESWPKPESGGMHVGMPKGIKATHIPTGCSAAHVSDRSMLHNRVAAIKELEELVEMHYREGEQG